MIAYCRCGAKHTYATIKPKTCDSCGELLEPKPVVREKPVAKRQPGYDPIERDEESVGELDFDAEAVRRSIRLQRDGNEGAFTTVTASWARNNPGFSRGGAPDVDSRDEVLNGLLTGKGLGKPVGDMAPPPDLDKPRSTARRQPNRIALPTE